MAFFPAYPLAARAVAGLSGCRPEAATLLVAHVFLTATFVLLHAYVRVRAAGGRPTPPPALVLLAFALFPTTFFFRLGYTESMFAFWCVLTLFGVERGWHPVWLAIVAGAATATGPPGAALGLVVLADLLRRRRPRSRPVRARRPDLRPVCGWGLIAYVLYQWHAFGEPLAFVGPGVLEQPPGADRGGRRLMLTLEPVWDTYYPRLGAVWWQGHDAFNHTPFSLQAANPLYFLSSPPSAGDGGNVG